MCVEGTKWKHILTHVGHEWSISQHHLLFQLDFSSWKSKAAHTSQPSHLFLSISLFNSFWTFSSFIELLANITFTFFPSYFTSYLSFHSSFLYSLSCSGLRWIHSLYWEHWVQGGRWTPVPHLATCTHIYRQFNTDTPTACMFWTVEVEEKGEPSRENMRNSKQRVTDDLWVK